MKVFKEIVLSILILIIILVTMGIVLYDKLPSLKKIPEAQEYSKSLEAEQILEAVVNQEDTKTAIKTYRMDRAEINVLSSNRRFEKGKSNPFADYSSNTSLEPDNSNKSSSSPSNGKIFDNSGGK